MARIPQTPSIKPFQLTGGATSARRPSAISTRSQGRGGFQIQARQTQVPVEKPFIDQVGSVVDGRVLQQVNDTVVRSAMQIADTITTRESKELAYRYQDSVYKLLNSETGFLNLNGKAAYDAKDSTLQQIKDLKVELLGSASADIRAKVFPALQAQEQKYQVLVGSHASNEFNAWDADVKKLALQSTIQDLALTYLDPQISIEKLTNSADINFPAQLDGTYDAKTKMDRIAFINSAISSTLETAYAKNKDAPEIATHLAEQLTSAKYNMGEDFYIDYNQISDIISRGEARARQRRVQRRQDKRQFEVDQKDIAIKDLNGLVVGGNRSGALRKLQAYVDAQVIPDYEKKKLQNWINGEQEGPNKNIYSPEYFNILQKIRTAKDVNDLDNVRSLIGSSTSSLHPSATNMLYQETVGRDSQLIGSARAAGLGFIKAKLEVDGRLVGPDDEAIFNDMMRETIAEYDPIIRHWVEQENLSTTEVLDRLKKDLFTVNDTGLKTFSPLGLGEATLDELHGLMFKLKNKEGELSQEDYTSELKKLQWQISMRQKLVKLDRSIDEIKVDDIKPVPFIDAVRKREKLRFNNNPSMFKLRSPIPPGMKTYPLPTESRKWLEPEDYLFDNPASIRSKIDSKFKSSISRSQKDAIADQLSNTPNKQYFRRAFRKLDDVTSVVQGKSNPANKSSTALKLNRVDTLKRDLVKLLDAQPEDQDRLIQNINLILQQTKGM